MPNTTDYLILGLVVIAVIMGLFIAGMVVRYRSLHQDTRLVEQLRDE